MKCNMLYSCLFLMLLLSNALNKCYIVIESSKNYWKLRTKLNLFAGAVYFTSVRIYFLWLNRRSYLNPRYDCAAYIDANLMQKDKNPDRKFVSKPTEFQNRIG